jgi:hypothetical protein
MIVLLLLILKLKSTEKRTEAINEIKTYKNTFLAVKIKN